MRRESLSLRERWQAVFQRERPGRIPMDFWGPDETVALLMTHFGCGSRPEALDKHHVDFLVKLRPAYAGPRLAPCRDAFSYVYKMMSCENGWV